jgi:hypothetical protein
MSTTTIIIIVVAMAIAALIGSRVNRPRVTQIDVTRRKERDE